MRILLHPAMLLLLMVFVVSAVVAAVVGYLVVSGAIAQPWGSLLIFAVVYGSYLVAGPVARRLPSRQSRDAFGRDSLDE